MSMADQHVPSDIVAMNMAVGFLNNYPGRVDGKGLGTFLMNQENPYIEAKYQDYMRMIVPMLPGIDQQAREKAELLLKQMPELFKQLAHLSRPDVMNFLRSLKFDNVLVMDKIATIIECHVGTQDTLSSAQQMEESDTNLVLPPNTASNEITTAA